MFSHIKELFTRPSGYSIAKSVRLRSSASAYFNRTPASASNRKTYTFSCWAKRGSLSSNQNIVAQGNNEVLFRFNTTDNINFADYTGGSAVWEITSSSVYRDPSAWYHIVFAIDTTQATSSNRVKVWINNSQVTFTGTYPTLNSDTPFNTTNAMLIGNRTGVSQYFDGYLTEINFIDGQALTPSSFGETDSITGVLKAKKYGGTYGTNGFYLNFSDNSSNTATTIGKDYSGNGNNWTPNNISVTAGATYDSMVDSPTVSAVSSNYAVLNPLNKAYSTYTLSDGNLNWTSSTINMGSHGTFQLPTSGKYYWEIVMTANAGGSPAIGIADGLDSLGSKGIEYRTSGNKEQNGGVSGNGSGAYGATWTTNDVIGVAYDADTSSGQITFYKNNSSQGVAYSSIQTNFPNGLFPSFQNNAAGTTTFQANFGQRPFTYTPPTGFVALNTYNLPASTISNGATVMAATTWTGNATSRSISNAVNGVSFQPDFVWIKNRTTAYGHVLQDVLRGTSVYLASNSTAADTAATLVTAFNSDGFSISTSNVINENSSGIVGWNWKAGGSGSSNTSGSITSTVSVNATAGFSIVTYTGNGSSSATVGHGLGVTPSMIIVKARSGGSDWETFHTSLGSSFGIRLNTTAAKVAASSTAGGIISTSPTSTTFGFTAGTSNVNNANENGVTFVAYCWSAVKGFSAFGSYTGNGSTDGPFVYTGFRPRFIMFKRTDAIASWRIIDTARETVNATQNEIYPNLSNAEAGAANGMDILSNGFKLRGSYSEWNASGGTFMYAAFAENPFKNALAR